MMLADIDLEKLAGLLALVISIIANFILVLDRNKAQKREIIFAGTPVDKKEFDQRITRIEDNTDRIWEKMEADKAEILKTGEERAGKTHDRINEVLAAVAELRGQVNANHRNR